MSQNTATEYEAVIGLEIHVQLSTNTKMFCGCQLQFGADPNTLTCPVCLGHPGTLPVPNEKAVRYAIATGLALGCSIAPRSMFHRKNYFYPDLPKGYQISQFDVPICSDGELAGVRIHRAHMEEDAAKNIHVGESGRIHGAGRTVVDYNRGGTPLVEIVTEPDIRSGAQAREWLQLLRATIKQLGVSDVNMEEGSLRCDANISIRPVGATELGTKTELKNMNSFRFIERGIDAEIARQTALVNAGEKVRQETLHFDPSTGSLTSLRSKEESHDYRYFPEPDLVPVAPPAELIEEIRASLPELPLEKADHFENGLGLSVDTARFLAFNAEIGAYYQEVLLEAGADVDAKRTADWVTGELVARIGADADPAESKVTPVALAQLVTMVGEKKVTNAGAKTVLDRLVESGGVPEQIVEAEGLAAMGDGDELAGIVDAALEANPKAVDDMKAGNMKAIGAVIGFVMKQTQGRADGGEVTRIVREKLGL
ncbi:MAG: Asp-tRNA(Asn)/Glu-tRNA(Gln) amidotransferase subunit GatB [Actinobacteria bacterium]|nr:Asp-tRNA(Asn)/Glu-tRNA(Gln) amidotransferase subunit GatB [Actinomycetota bacterium]